MGTLETSNPWSPRKSTEKKKPNQQTADWAKKHRYFFNKFVPLYSKLRELGLGFKL